MSSNYSGRTTPYSDVDHPHRITYYPFSEISNRSLKDIAEKPSAPTATNLDTGKRTATSTNAHIANYTNPTTRNTYASSNHLDLTVNPKHPLNKNHPPHHHSPSESHIKKDSKQENPYPPSHHPPRPPLPAEKSPKIREKEKKETSYPRTKKDRKGH